MEFRAVVKRLNNRHIELLLEDEPNTQELLKHAVNGQILAYVDFYEKDGITDLQRNHLYALFGDIAAYIGLLPDAVEVERKYRFMLDEGLDELPSLARGRMRKTTASKFLEHTIEYCIGNGIPFRKQRWYLTMDTSKMLFALTMKRICWVCGRPHSDIAHVEAVGAGRNRKKVDHTQHHFMCLCREHHNLQHKMGIDSFIKEYHIQPIKLNAEHIKELGI